MSSIKSISDGLRLDDVQVAWIQPWLSKFGAWVYSGRIEKRQSTDESPNDFGKNH